MTQAERLARLLLTRMKEIDPSKGEPGGVPDEVPGYEHYELLWDPVLDEIKAVCPDVYAEVDRVPVWRWMLEPVQLPANEEKKP